jgi:hypothetical protein
MKTFYRMITGKETICSHSLLLLFNLHGERRTQVYQVSVSQVWKLRIRKPFGIIFPQRFKPGFPKKIDQRGKRRGRWYAMIVFFEMVVMEEFDMSQASKLKKDG